MVQYASIIPIILVFHLPAVKMHIPSPIIQLEPGSGMNLSQGQLDAMFASQKAPHSIESSPLSLEIERVGVGTADMAKILRLENAGLC